MSSVSTHVLDTALGKPAAGIHAVLEVQTQVGEWTQLGHTATDGDGRIKSFVPPHVSLAPGVYRLRFDTGADQAAFYPEVIITFRIDSPAQHYHVPLLLSPFGYSTYRGS